MNTFALHRRNLKRAMARDRAELDLLKVACEIVGVHLRAVPVSDARPSHFTTASQNGRKMGTIGDLPCQAVIDMLPIGHFIDEGNPLRKRIDEAAAAEMARAA